MKTGHDTLTGRCYCGAITFVASEMPQDVVYCHCIDCRRAAGAPVSVFAALNEGTVTFSPNDGQKVSVAQGATRSFCANCGSSVTGRYDYLPNQVFIPIGIIDQADALEPSIHVHDNSRLSWLHINDDLERIPTSGRAKIDAKS